MALFSMLVFGQTNLANQNFSNFFQALIIFFREGFEAMLIVGAIIAYIGLEKKHELKKFVYYGVFFGVIASILTAVLFQGLFDSFQGLQELLEGLTLLLASIVLLYTSHWLLAKSHSLKWAKYIKKKVGVATKENNALLLISASFLAVYREGFETVLFFKALLVSVTNLIEIFLGVFTAIILLAILFFVFLKAEKRLEIGKVFLSTGLILFLFAFSFAGKGVHELQEAGILSETSISFIPKIPILSVYPTIETILMQTIILVIGVLPLLNIKQNKQENQ